MQRYDTFKTVIILQYLRLRSVVVKTETESLTCFMIAQVLYKFYKVHELKKKIDPGMMVHLRG